MATRIAVFADGTGNTVDRHDSNVLRLCRMLDLADDSEQVAIYDPGVGTSATVERLRAILGERVRLMERAARRPRPVRWARLLFELGFGLGTAENIRQLYEGVIREYQPGADIYLFGFSRGAFTIRALAGLIYRCGVPRRPDASVIDAAMSLYRQHYEACRNDEQLRVLKAAVERFKQNEAHVCDIRFLGIWDTVKAVGYFWPKNLPHIRHNPIVRTVRHAMSLAERRTFYVPTTWGGLDGDTRPAIYIPAHLTAAREGAAKRYEIEWQDLQEVWFAGDHSDVGGGRPERPLADVALHWMVNEAHDCGLRVRRDEYADLVRRVRTTPLSPTDVHDELWRMPFALGWWITELAPRRDIVNEPPPPRRPPRVLRPAGRRMVANSARDGIVRVHRSATDCYEAGQPAPWNEGEVRFVETIERVRST
jgi:uncharacterized protein (DUF2235 family)